MAIFPFFYLRHTIENILGRINLVLLARFFYGKNNLFHFFSPDSMTDKLCDTNGGTNVDCDLVISSKGTPKS
jgi:hypothetical protein